MGYTVVPEGDMTDSTYREYVRQLARVLLKRGAALERVPRTPANGNGQRWLYVWDSEQEARDFAKQLTDGSDAESWQVRPVEVPVNEGPLQPLEIEIGRALESVTLALEPLTELALQARFPGSCQTTSVTVRTSYDGRGKVAWQASRAGLSKLAEQVLPILTGLSLDELQPFGGYQVVDGQTEELLLPPTPFHSGTGEGPNGSRCQALR